MLRRLAGHVGRAGHRDELLLADQPVEQLGVVDDLVLAAELRVLVLDGVEAVRAGDDDLGRADLVEGLDVLLGEHLEEELVAGPSGRVAGAGLAVAEDREGDPGLVEQLGHGAGGLLGAVLVGAGAADPEQVVDVVGGLDVLAEDLDLERQVLGPVEPGAGGHAPRVALVLEVLEQAAELVGERALDEVLVAAHVDDRVDVLDVDRALLDAGAAGGAGPQHVLVDDRVGPVRVVGRERVGDVVAGVADQRHLGQRWRRPRRSAVALGLGGEQPRRLGVRVVAQRHHEHLGRQRLVGVPGRALALAAAALGAGVKSSRPFQVKSSTLPTPSAASSSRSSMFSKSTGSPLDHHRLELAERGAAVGVPLEEDVEEGQEPVPGDTHRRLQRDGDHPRERDEDLHRGDDDDDVLDACRPTRPVKTSPSQPVSG